MQWPTEKEQTDKKSVTKHYTENYTKHAKIGVKSRTPEG